MATSTTAAKPEAETDPPPPAGLRPYHITTEVYERIADSGAMGRKCRAFLWKGQLVEKVADVTRGRPHVNAVNILGRLLLDLVHGRGYFVEHRGPIALGDDSEPEPDLKCVRGAIDDYAERVPTARDCPVVIEVADSSLADDKGEMLRGYAAAGVPEYWVVNIPDRRIEVYTGPGRPDPGGLPGYSGVRHYGSDDEVPVVLDGREVGRVAVREVLPR